MISNFVLISHFCVPLIMREYFLILLRFDEVTENDF